MIAYFIGGPWDLTKRVLDKAPPYYRVAEMEPLRELGTHDDFSAASVKIHMYELVGRATRDVGIYVHTDITRKGLK